MQLFNVLSLVGMPVLFSILTLHLESIAYAQTAPDCSSTKIQELLAPASDERPEVVLNCRATLSGNGHTITKKVIFQGTGSSGAMLDCQGSQIRPSSSAGIKYSVTVRSRQDSEGNWQRPENVTIRNCTIYGSARVYGLAPVASDEMRESSYSLGHTARMQAAAPRFITFDRVVIIASGTTPLYFSTGVNHSSLLNSELKGTTSSVALYLDAETGYNTIKNNYIHVNSEKREQIALDGSAYNRIINNRLSGLSTGGINLYRNCGERSVVRHQTPSYNQIINNIFYYNTYSGDNPAIYVGSRNTFGFDFKNFFDIGYCDDDDGYDFGSSKSDEDFARYNVIAENQIINRSVSDMIKETYSPNYYFYNERVSTPVARLAGCYYSIEGKAQLLRDGEIYAIKSANGMGMKFQCQDNKLVYLGLFPVSNLEFSCLASGSNAGCSKSFSCPLGKTLVGLKAACNLEYGAVTSGFLSALGEDGLAVERASDRVSDGLCSIWTSLKHTSLSSGSKSLAGSFGRQSYFTATCREYDANGGDCHVKGVYQCL